MHNGDRDASLMQVMRRAEAGSETGRALMFCDDMLLINSEEAM